MQLKDARSPVRSTAGAHTFLGYRVSRRGIDLGPKAIRRFRRRLAELAASGDAESLRRSLVAWRGAVGLGSQ